MTESSANGLPKGWTEATLPQVASVNPPLDRCVINDDVEVCFVPMRAVAPEGGGLVAPETRRYGEVKKGYTSFLSGDVIMAKITPCMENGKTTVIPDVPGHVCFGSTEFHVARAEAGISPRWLAAFLVQHDVRRAAQRAMTGGVGQMRVPQSFLETLRLPIAPTAEQSRIADELEELFSDLDAGVAALERVQAKLKHYRASVLKAAVEGALTADWRAKHPKTEPATDFLARILAERRRRWEEDQLAKFKKAGKEPPKNWKAKYQEPAPPDTTDLPALPDGWCWATLGQISTLITSGSRGWADYYSQEGPLFVRSQDIRTDRLLLADVAHVTPPRSSEGVRTRLACGDLLVTITGANVAKAAFVADEIGEAYVSQHVGLVRLIDSGTGTFTHMYVIAPSAGRRRLLLAAYGAGKPGLNLDNLRELPLPFPPLREMTAIAEAVEDQLSVIDHLESDITAKLKEAQSLRQSILRHAFAGKLVPQNPKDEPAAELLKRIAAECEERARQEQSTRRVRPGRPTKAKKS